MLFTHFHFTQGQKLETWFYRQEVENILALNPQLYCQQIDKKSIYWYNQLLNMFFHRCSYKNSCFIELVFKSNVPVLMICSFKKVLKDLALDLFFVFGGLLLVYT